MINYTPTNCINVPDEAQRSAGDTAVDIVEYNGYDKWIGFNAYHRIRYDKTV